MNFYLSIKSLHLLFAIAWMAAVFYLPRILVNLAEAGDVAPVRERLLLMGRRLYTFGHAMFGLALLLGLALWFGHLALPATLPDPAAGRHWIDAKLALVVVLLGYYIVSGRWLKGVAAGKPLPAPQTLRWFNELPVLLLLAVIYLALAKPF
ncbi:MAG: CopD family protein [Luteimonas sp.]